MKRRRTAAILGLTLLAGCTSVEVEPVPAAHALDHVLIRENPKVAVADFLDVLVEGFERNGVRTSVISPTAGVGSAYEVTYVAYRNWDLAPYLRDATISVYSQGRRIGHAVYHLVGGGGLSLTKWRGTRTKILPVVDELLSQQARGPSARSGTH